MKFRLKKSTEKVEEEKPKKRRKSLIGFDPHECRIGFGQHRGTLYINLEPHYLRWIVENFDRPLEVKRAKAALDFMGEWYDDGSDDVVNDTLRRAMADDNYPPF